MTHPILLADTEREVLIRYYRELISGNGSSKQKRDWANRMRDLINGRSDERVKEMELEKGLI